MCLSIPSVCVFVITVNLSPTDSSYYAGSIRDENLILIRLSHASGLGEVIGHRIAAVDV